MLDGGFDRGVGIAEGCDTDTAEEVEEVVAVGIAQKDTVPTDEEIGVPLIGVEEQLALCCLNRCQVHATMDLRSVVDAGGDEVGEQPGRLRGGECVHA